MNVRNLIWATAKVGVVVMFVGVAALALARDSRPASASHTEILPSLSGTSATTVGSIVLVKGGQYASNTPCNPGDNDPTTACIHVWAKNVDNTTGASAFQVGFTYPDNALTVSAVQPKVTWLGSTGRSVACASPFYGPGEAKVSCNTLLAPPPYGPNCANGHCTGELATIALESKDTVGIYTVDFSQEAYLVDTPPNPDNLAPIPATIRSFRVAVAPCADFNGDGTVRVADILYVVSKYFTNDTLADLNASGIVIVDDILIAIGEYFIACTP